MKRKTLVLLLGALLIAVNGFAADGDFIVEGNLNVSSGGLVYDSSTDRVGIGVGVETPSEKLEVNGKIKLTGTGGQVNILSVSPGNFRIQNTSGNVSLALENDLEGTNVFFFKGGQQDHLSAVNGGNFDFYYFEHSSSGKNKQLRLYGFPSSASARNYAFFQIIGGNNDLDIETNNPNADILLNSVSGNVGIGTKYPKSRLAVSGLPTSAPDSSGTQGIVCITIDGNMWVDEAQPYDCL